MSPVEYREFKSSETWRSCISIGTMCRMHMHGAPFTKERIQWIKDKIENEILRPSRSNSNESTSSSTTRLSPALLVKRRSENYIADLEEIVDKWDKLETPFSLYDDLKKNEVPSLTAKMIYDYYLNLHNELQSAI